MINEINKFASDKFDKIKKCIEANITLAFERKAFGEIL